MKRTIIINEKQAYRLGLLEQDDAGNSQIFNGNNETTYPGTEKIVVSPIIHDQNGDDISANSEDAPYASIHDTDHDMVGANDNGFANRYW